MLEAILLGIGTTVHDVFAAECLKSSLRLYSPWSSLPIPLICPLERSCKTHNSGKNTTMQLNFFVNYDIDNKLHLKSGIMRTLPITWFPSTVVLPIRDTQTTFPVGELTCLLSYIGTIVHWFNNSSLNSMWLVVPVSIIHSLSTCLDTSADKILPLWQLLLINLH